VILRGVGERFKQGQVGDRDAAAGLEDAADFTPNLRFVGRKIEDAVGDDDIDGGVGDREVFNFAEAEFDVVEAGGAAVFGEVAAGTGEHIGCHVDADDVAGWADFAAGNEHVDAATAAEVEDLIAGLQGGDGGGVAARKAEVGAGGQVGEVCDGVAKVFGQGIGRGRAATTAAFGGVSCRGATAGGAFTGDFAVAGADLFTDGVGIVGHGCAPLAWGGWDGWARTSGRRATKARISSRTRR